MAESLAFSVAVFSGPGQFELSEAERVQHPVVPSSEDHPPVLVIGVVDVRFVGQVGVDLVVLVQRDAGHDARGGVDDVAEFPHARGGSLLHGSRSQIDVAGVVDPMDVFYDGRHVVARVGDQVRSDRRRVGGGEVREGRAVQRRVDRSWRGSEVPQPQPLSRLPETAEVFEVHRGGGAVRHAVAVGIDPPLHLGDLRHVVEIELGDVVVGEVQFRVDRGLLADGRVGEEGVHEVPHVLERPRPPDDVVPEGAARVEHRLEEVRAAPLPRGEDRGRRSGGCALEDPGEGVPRGILQLRAVEGLVEVVRLPVVVLVPRRLRSGEVAPVVFEPPVDGGVPQERGPFPEGEDREQCQVLRPGDVVYPQRRAPQVGRVHVEGDVLDPGGVPAGRAGREGRGRETAAVGFRDGGAAPPAAVEGRLAAGVIHEGGRQIPVGARLAVGDVQDEALGADRPPGSSARPVVQRVRGIADGEIAACVPRARPAEHARLLCEVPGDRPQGLAQRRIRGGPGGVDMADDVAEARAADGVPDEPAGVRVVEGEPEAGPRPHRVLQDARHRGRNDDGAGEGRRVAGDRGAADGDRRYPRSPSGASRVRIVDRERPAAAAAERSIKGNVGSGSGLDGAPGVAVRHFRVELVWYPSSSRRSGPCARCRRAA